MPQNPSLEAVSRRNSTSQNAANTREKQNSREGFSAVKSSLLTTKKAISVDDKVASGDDIIKPDYTSWRGKCEKVKTVP